MSKLTIYLSLVCVLLLTSCGKPETRIVSADNGGQDSGGGNTRGSTHSQVEYYLKDEEILKKDLAKVLDSVLFRKPHKMGFHIYLPGGRISSFEKNNPELVETIIQKMSKLDKNFEKAAKLNRWDFTKDSNENADKNGNIEKKDNCTNLSLKQCEALRVKERSREIRSYFDKLSPNENSALDYENMYSMKKTEDGNYSEDFSIFITSKMIIQIKSDGPCIDRHNKQKMGSVKEFNFNSPVCLSISELTKVPPDSLQKEIYGLLSHELMHLLGFYENDAEKLQDHILSNYDEIKSYKDPSFTIKILLEKEVYQFSKILSKITRDFKRQDFAKYSTYNNEKFNSLWFDLRDTYENNEILVETFLQQGGYRDLNNDDKLEVSSAIHNLNEIIKEINSLSRVLYEIEVSLSGEKPSLNKKEDYYFIHDRLIYLSEQLDSVYTRLDKIL